MQLPRRRLSASVIKNSSSGQAAAMREDAQVLWYFKWVRKIGLARMLQTHARSDSRPSVPDDAAACRVRQYQRAALVNRGPVQNLHSSCALTFGLKCLG